MNIGHKLLEIMTTEEDDELYTYDPDTENWWNR